MSVLLTRVECICGMVAAIPEGGFFPLCGRCGRRMVCPSGDARRERGLSYVATLCPELGAVRAAVEERKAAGGPTPDDEEAFRANHRRQFTDEDLRASLEQRGWPTEPQPWPTVPDPATDSGEPGIPIPPWEVTA